MTAIMNQHVLSTLLRNCTKTSTAIFMVGCQNLSSFATRDKSENYENITGFTTQHLKENVIAQPNFDEELVHIPVMTKEVVDSLQPKDNQCILDMTFGAGGHSKHLLNAASIKLIALDRDPASHKEAINFAKYNDSVTPLLGRFSEIREVFKFAKIAPNSLDGILIDAGCSSMQMDTASRGFSISKDGILDMRMDGDRFPDQPTAADVLNTLDVPSLAKIFKVYGEEKHAKKVAQALFDARYMLQTINTTKELADLVQSILGGEQRYDRLQRPAHVATKVFQALRIFVNNELNELNYGLDMAYEYLKPGGKLVTLTFHSLEDRIVKRHMVGIDMDEPVTQNIRQKFSNALLCHSKDAIDGMYSNRWISLHKHVVKPSTEEINKNPRSRSAKLRTAIKNKDP